MKKLLSKAMRLLALLLCFVLRSHAGDSKDQALFKLTDILPTGQGEIEIMTIQYPERIKELALKMEAAVATNRDWFLEHIKNSKRGEPLEYDPKLGMTKDEWAEFLREAKGKLTSTGTRLPCVFHREGDTLSIHVKDDDSPLNKIRLNTKTGELIASVGSIGTPTWKAKDDASIPIGAYEGYSWKYEKGDLDTFTARTVSLDILRLKASGKILWLFHDKEMVNKEMKDVFETMFQHSPKNVESKMEPTNPKTQR